MIFSLADLPPIETERLRLRPLGRADVEAFHAMTDDPSILDAVHILARPFTSAQAAKLLVGAGDGRDLFWGACLRDDTTLLGTVGTHLHGEREIEIGYWFSPAARGRGLAAEAIAAIATALSAACPGRRVVAECRPENEASWRLLEKVGFRASGEDGDRPGRRRLVLA